ncbi:adenosine deaminase [Kocuria rhizophila]|uniref:adenosine deaminase n=1 Tax=Kocuria rhizophila (strain ATCC 9341 / DSM 348 / NBRC 103217 / DC2201) TaxID=378753 RepID=B2GM15_KOCRD|nr:adenosine deaminase [Kocuria rhizophila]ASE12091.1 adenosine deaminase [Kocuria rhizophila]MDV5999684.1 adenosine deaminase [Kocuria rhizophila]BAG30131.1 adenosine deaminase [Kocuria rhizophila DC2201]VEH74600.1 Adenine deaminase [Kocuria rhizophila]
MTSRATPEGPVRTTDGALGPHALISLHDHLDGALRPATVVELAAQVGHELPATDPDSLGQWFRDSADSGSLPRYLETFSHTVAVMQTASALRRVAREYVEDCAADGLVHAEVRWAPEQHVSGGLTLGEAVDAVQGGLAEGVAAVRAAGGHLSVVQILCAMRHLDRSPEIARLVVRRVRAAEQTTTPHGSVAGEPSPGSVVGFDLAGPEAGFPASGHREALDLLAGERIPVTLHAGEAAGAESMADALDAGRALRLGHGVRLLDEDRGMSAPLTRWIRDRRIALEVCPCSNLQTDASAAWGTTVAEHPVTAMLRAGFAVTVSPDNRLMSATSVTHELDRLRAEAGWSEQDVLAVQRTAARAAFVPREYQDWLERRVTGEAS